MHHHTHVSVVDRSLILLFTANFTQPIASFPKDLGRLTIIGKSNYKSLILKKKNWLKFSKKILVHVLKFVKHHIDVEEVNVKYYLSLWNNLLFGT